MTDRLAGFTETEQAVTERLLVHIEETRKERAEKVQDCIEQLEKEDEVTRMIARIMIEHYIRDTEITDLLSEPFLPIKTLKEAPGLYIAFGEIREMIVDSGEFFTLDHFAECAESLGFRREDARHAVGFLFQWLAAQYPDSEAAKTVKDFGLASGKMSHTFNVPAILIHESAVEKYTEAVRTGASPRREIIDPIVHLAAHDDWELATSFMTKHQLRRIS